MARIEECPKCERPFSVVTSGDYPFRDNESIVCPHCKHVCETNKVRFDYTTTALSPDEEAAYLKNRRK